MPLEAIREPTERELRWAKSRQKSKYRGPTEAPEQRPEYLLNESEQIIDLIRMHGAACLDFSRDRSEITAQYQIHVAMQTLRKHFQYMNLCVVTTVRDRGHRWGDWATAVLALGEYKPPKTRPS